MSRMLLICAMVVACVYAGQKKGMSVKNNGKFEDKYLQFEAYFIGFLYVSWKK